MNFTASKVGDLFACSWQFRNGIELLPDEQNEAAVAGTYLHALIEAHLNGVCDPVPVPEFGDAAAQERIRDRGARIFDRWLAWWDIGHHGDHDWQTEVPFAISLTTGKGRQLPSAGQRDYSAATPDEVAGTIDLFALTPDAVIVWDTKTTLRPEYTTEAPQNKQLKTLALAAARAFDREHAKVGLLFANEFDTRLEPAEFDTLDLDRHLRALRERAFGIEFSSPTPGTHCRFCRARVGCSEVPKQYRVKRKAA